MEVLKDLFITFVEYLPIVTGAYISILILRFPDLTIEASWSLGGIVACLSALAFSWPLWTLPVLGLLVGALCGAFTGLIFQLTGRVKLLSGLIAYMILSALGFHLTGDEASIYFKEGVDLKRFGFGNDSYVGVLIYAGFSFLCFILIVIWQKSWIGVASRMLGEKPQGYHFFNLSLDRTYVFGLMMSNALVGMGGALFGLYHGSASNVQGIGLILLAFFALLIGDELLKLITKSERTEPWSILVGLAIYVLLTQMSEYGQAVLNKYTELDWVRPTDKQIVIGIALVALLWLRGLRKGRRKDVSLW